MKLIEGKDPVDYSKEELAQLSKSTLINEVIPTYQEEIRHLRQENKCNISAIMSGKPALRNMYFLPYKPNI